MKTALSFPRTRLLVAWTVTSMLGWALAPINAFDAPIQTYVALAWQMLGFLLCGLLMGAVIAAGQAGALRRYRGADGRRWLWATLLGYSLMLPAGLALHTVLVFPAFGVDFLPLTAPSTIYLFTLPQAAIFGGIAVGLAQWQALKHFVPRRDGVMAALWIFGTWASLTVGWLFGSIMFSSLVHSFGPADSFALAHRMLIGLWSGFFHGLLLLLALGAEAQPTPAAPPGAR